MRQRWPHTGPAGVCRVWAWSWCFLTGRNARSVEAAADLCIKGPCLRIGGSRARRDSSAVIAFCASLPHGLPHDRNAGFTNAGSGGARQVHSSVGWPFFRARDPALCSGGPVDALPDEIGTTVVTCVFLDHVHHDPAQGDPLVAGVMSFLLGQRAGVVQQCVGEQVRGREQSLPARPPRPRREPLSRVVDLVA